MKRTPSLSIGRETFLALGSKALMAALGFAGILIFANVLGDVGLGEYRTVMAAALVLSQLPAGTATAIKKRVSEVDVAPGPFLGAGLLAHLGFSLLTLLGLLLVRPYAVDYFGTTRLAFGVVAAVVAVGLFNVTNRFYSGIGYPALSSWVDSARSVLTLGAQLLFLWAGLEAFGLVLGFVVAAVLSAVLSMVVAGVVPEMPGRRVFDRVYDFARWSVPNSFLTNLYGSADVLILRAVVGAGAVGVYTVAAQLAMPAAMFGGSIRDALSVKSSGVDSEGGDVRADLKNALSYSGLIAIPMVFGALAIPEALMRTLFGPDFRDAPGLALVGMTLFQLMNVYRQPFEAVIEGTDRPESIFRTNVLIVVVHLPLAALMGYFYGLLGVIASTVVVGALRVAVYQYIAHEEYGGVVFTRPVIDQVLAGVAMYLVVWGLATYVVRIRSWVWLVVVVGIGAAVYFLALLAVSRHFRETLRHTLPFLPTPGDSDPEPEP